MGRRVKVVVRRSNREIQLFNVMLRVAQKVTPSRRFPKVFGYREQNRKVNSQKGVFFLHVVFSTFTTHSASSNSDEFMKGQCPFIFSPKKKKNTWRLENASANLIKVY